MASGLKKGFLSKKARLLPKNDHCLNKQEVKMKPYISHCLDADEWISNSDEEKYGWLKQEKMLKQPCFSSSLNDTIFDIEKAWITFIDHLERFEQHCFAFFGQMAFGKIELSSLDDLFTNILFKVVEERYHY